MEYVIISDQEDRVIKLGWTRGERYADEVSKGWDPWWDFHVIVKKPCINYDCVSESMMESELLDLMDCIYKSREIDIFHETGPCFMEPDYNFTMSEFHGILSINVNYADSIQIWLERKHLDAIAEYLKKALNAS